MAVNQPHIDPAGDPRERELPVNPLRTAIKKQNLAQLRQLLHGQFLALFGLPGALERAFRSGIRQVAATFLRRSIYVLIVIYLVVVTPVLLLSVDADKQVWFWFAVFPIGVVLSYLWVASRIPAFEEYVERLLGFSVWVCLSGTLYAGICIGDRTLGYVAGFESVYIIMIAFSILRIRTSVALISCVLSAFAAVFLALVNAMPIDWVQFNLFFAAPLIVGMVNGYIQESTNRRDFVQAVYQSSQVMVLKEIMLAGDAEDDESICLERAMREVMSALDWQAMAMFVENDDGRVLIEAECLNESVARRSEGEIWSWPDCHALVSRVLADGKVHVLRVRQPGGERFGYDCLAMPVPLAHHSHGVLLCLANRLERVDEEVVDFMGQVADHLGRIVERIRQHNMLQHMALHDALTGLKNRIAFMQDLEAAFARRQRNPAQGFAVLYMDLDRFKWVNDNLGHHAGDALLRTFSDRVSARIRNNDSVARLGGDEFAVLVECVDEAAVLDLVRRIQRTHDEAVTIDGQQINIIASIGVCMARSDHEGPDEILAEADAAMYTAKAARVGSFHVHAAGPDSGSARAAQAEK